jgi:hypothetical protein
VHWKTWWPRSGTETFHARKLQSSPKFWASPSPPCNLARAKAQRFFPPAIWRSTSGTSGKRHQLDKCLGFANTPRAASAFQISAWTQKQEKIWKNVIPSSSTATLNVWCRKFMILWPRCDKHINKLNTSGMKARGTTVTSIGYRLLQNLPLSHIPILSMS